MHNMHNNIREMQNQNKKNQQNLSEQISQDSCVQRQALPLDDLINQNCNQAQKQAYLYLMNVRNQANTLKIAQKQKQKDYKYINCSQKLELQEEIMKQEQWFEIWKKEAVQNWECITQNCKYLLNNGKQPITNKFNLSLSQVPQIHQVLWLPLGILQENMAKMSEQYFQTKKGKYYIWMYSLLAVHQSKASYTNFAGLADISSCIESQQVMNSQILILTLILNKHFSQRNLSKKLKPCQSC